MVLIHGRLQSTRDLWPLSMSTYCKVVCTPPSKCMPSTKGFQAQAQYVFLFAIGPFSVHSCWSYICTVGSLEEVPADCSQWDVKNIRWKLCLITSLITSWEKRKWTRFIFMHATAPKFTIVVAVTGHKQTTMAVDNTNSSSHSSKTFVPLKHPIVGSGSLGKTK